jgi:cytochrome c peroxidase
LFFDARLGSDGKTSCATCHDPAHGYAGKNDMTAAGKPNLRRTPALVNLAWAKDLGWDGRYHSLDEQLPAHIRGQLGDDLEPALKRLAELPLYKAHLARVGGTPAEAALHALAAYVLTRYDGDSPWDRLEPTMRMPKPGAPVDPIVAGYVVFTGKAQCAVCHTPPLYTDSGYHKVEVGTFADDGRGKVDPTQAGAFRTPTLRGAANRVAFFHSGAKTTLDEVVDYYLADHGAAALEVKKIALSPAERTSLLAFLRALSGPTVTTKPVLP